MALRLASMLAKFFQGTLGGFVAYSQIGGSPAAQAPGPNGQPPGSYYTPATPEKNSGTHGGGTTSVGANVTVSGGGAPVGQNTSDTGRKGLASH